MDWNEAVETVLNRNEANEVVREEFDELESVKDYHLYRVDDETCGAKIAFYWQDNKGEDQKRAHYAVRMEEYINSKDVVKEDTLEVEWDRFSLTFHFEVEPTEKPSDAILGETKL